MPVAIIVVVITEMIGDSIGLGYYITIWSTRFTFANVYAAIIVIGICGLVLDQGSIWDLLMLVMGNTPLESDKTLEAPGSDHAPARRVHRRAAPRREGLVRKA